MKYELRPFTAGEAVGKGFTVLFERLPYFLLLGTCFAVPTALATRYFASLNGDGVGGALLSFVLLMSASMLVPYLATAFFTQKVSSFFLGREERRGRLPVALATLPAVLGAALLTYLAFMGGFILLVVPGFIFLAGFSLSTVCIVVEGLGPIDGMKRSWQLSKGRRWKILFLVLVQFLLTLAIQLAASILLRFSGLDATWQTVLASSISQAVTLPLNAAMDVVYYLGIRVDREALDVERLAADFGLPSPDQDLAGA